MNNKYMIQTVELINYKQEVVGVQFHYNTTGGIIKSHVCGYQDGRKLYNEMGETLGFESKDFKPYGKLELELKKAG